MLFTADIHEIKARSLGDEEPHGVSGPARLPHFVIIGAAKAATTWLSTVLARQPKVFMPQQEVHFFNRHYQLGLNWYVTNFADAGPDQIIGEKSASYLADPQVPGRLARLLPEAHLIVQLRDPVERAYSDYCMLLRRGEVSDNIARYLDPDDTPVRRFVDDGLYAHHLAAFLKVFPQTQVKILFYDDILRDPGNVYRDIICFIGLVEAMPIEEIAQRVKDKTTPMLPLPARRLLRPLKGLVRPWRDRAALKKIHGLFARPVAYPPLAETTRRRLAAFYADDVRVLEKLVDRRLDGWLKPSVTNV